MSCDGRFQPTGQVDARDRFTCVVVGAGIKGLYVARCMHARGVGVTVLESSDRVGGKVHTTRCGTAFAELGAMRIVDSQQAVHQLIDDLGLETEPYIEDNDACPIQIGSTRGVVAQLCVGILAEEGLISGDTLSASGLQPGTPFHRALVAAFADSRHEDHGLSVAQYLATPCEPTDAARRRIATAILDLRNGTGSLHTVALVREFMKILELHSGDPCQVKGGMDTLIHGLVAALPVFTVKCGCEVTRVTDAGASVDVEYTNKDGKRSMITASTVLLANSAAHEIEFDPALPVAQQCALDELRTSCSPAMKTVLYFRERFWESQAHGSVVAGTSWIGPSEFNQVLYPQRSTHQGAGGFLMIYIRGAPMFRWLELSEYKRLESALTAIQQLFPTADVHGLFEHSQDAVYDKVGEGAYCLHATQELFDRLTPHGRVVLSPVPRGWINDALIDGLVAVEQVLAFHTTLRPED